MRRSGREQEQCTRSQGLRCVGHSKSWSNAFVHGIQRCIGHIVRWSGILGHGIRLDVLHQNKCCFNQGRRHPNRRNRIGRENRGIQNRPTPSPPESPKVTWRMGAIPKLSAVSDLRQEKDSSVSEVFSDDLRLNNLHHLDDWHCRFQEVRR